MNRWTAYETNIRNMYEQLTRFLIDHAMTVALMESCTGGLIASLLTDTEGASAILQGAFVTYSNAAKIRQGVPETVIETCGVYSPATAGAMARACRETYAADIGIGVTGSFGNIDPNNPDSVPGEVFFAICTAQGSRSFRCSIPPQPSRIEYKLYTAEQIAVQLQQVLGTMYADESSCM